MRAWLHALLASALAEVRFFLRERSVLAVLLGVPLLYPLVVSSLYSAHQAVERPALLVDLDGSALSRRLALFLDAAQDVRVVGRPTSLEAGLDELRRGDVELLVYLPSELSRRVKRGERAEVRAFVATSNIYTYGLGYPALAGVVQALDADLGRAALERRGVAPTTAALRVSPVQVEPRFLFHPTGSYARFLVAGILLMVVQQLVVVSLAFSAGARRELGAWERGERRPAARLLGMALAHAPFWLAGVAFIVFGTLPWFDWAPVSGLSTALLFAAFALSVVPAAMVAATLVPDRVSAMQYLMFFSAPLFMISGFTWPAAQMPASVRAVAAAFPSTPALQALRVLSMKSGRLAAVAPQLRWLALLFLLHAAVAWLLVCRPWRRLSRQA